MEKEEKNQIYEVGYHIIPMVAEENVGAIVTACKDAVTENGGVIIAEEFPKMRPLAYAIRKKIGGKYNTFSTAYFGHIKFEAPVENVQKIEKAFTTNEQILRSLLITTVRENTMAPQKVFAPRAEKTAVKGPALGLKKAEDKAPVSEEELDKTIAELVVE